MDVNNYQNYDEEINLVEYLLFVIKEWRKFFLILFISILVGLAICGYKYFTSNTSRNYYSETDIQNMNDSDLRGLLGVSAIELENMEFASSYRQLYENQKEYIENSAFVQLDSTKVMNSLVFFQVTRNDEVESLESLVSRFLEEFQNVSPEFGFNIFDFEHFVSCSIDKEDDNNISTVAFKLIGVDTESLNSMVDYVFSNFSLLLNSNGNTIVFEYDEPYISYDQEIGSKQNSIITAAEKYRDNAVALENELSGNAKLYYELKFNGNNQIINSIANILNDVDTFSLSDTFKLLLVASICGVILGLGLIFIKFTCDSAINFTLPMYRTFATIDLGLIKNSRYFDKVYLNLLRKYYQFETPSDLALFNNREIQFQYVFVGSDEDYRIVSNTFINIMPIKNQLEKINATCILFIPLFRRETKNITKRRIRNLTNLNINVAGIVYII